MTHDDFQPPDIPDTDAAYLLRFIRRVLESPDAPEQDRQTAIGMTQELRDWATLCAYKSSDSPVREKHKLTLAGATP